MKLAGLVLLTVLMVGCTRYENTVVICEYRDGPAGDEWEYCLREDK